MRAGICFILLLLVATGQAKLRKRDLQDYTVFLQKAAGIDTTVCNCITAPCDCGGQNPVELDETNLKTCPETAPYVTCINEPNPVTCGKLNCHYNNDCLASGAGWNVATQCVFVPDTTDDDDYYYYDDDQADDDTHSDDDTVSCPETKPYITCPDIYDPIFCGENDCLYINGCLAGGADWDTMTECEYQRDRCEKPSGEISCIEKFEPVRCGINNCQYDNFCVAGDSGYSEEDCTRSNDGKDCPDINILVLCPVQDVAYACGPEKCYYGGECLATAGAGWDLEQDCVVVSDGGEECPKPEPGVFCITLYAPVKCGECEYSNACQAAAAGITEECVDVIVDEEVVCAIPDPEVFCTKIYAPVTCDGCEYSNLCQAEAAGYNEDQCDGIPIFSCPLPDPAVRCAQSEFAYECGPESCFYDSMCLATVSGYNVKEECTPVPREGSEELCPDPNPAVRCGQSEFAYECGPHSCFYESMCLATASGYNVDEECISIAKYVEEEEVCPLPNPAIRCSLEGGKYSCGSKRCVYESMCLATAAGFTVDEECVALTKYYDYDDKGCPITDPDIRCIEIYEPVDCTRDDIENKCLYSNKCYAENAGWMVDSQCEAVPLQTCPEPTQKRCSRVRNPITCSNQEYTDCTYGNRCEAEAAGFNTFRHC